jgi:hypothetical protein
VAVCDFRARRRQNHLARLAAVQPVAQHHAGKRFLSLAALPPTAVHADPLDSARQRPVLFCSTPKKHTDRRWKKQRVDMWPFFTWHRDFNGNNAVQILAPLNRCCRTIAASSATGRRSGRCGGGKQSQNRREQPVVAVEFYRRDTRRTPKNARSCSAFSSINLMEKQKVAPVLHSGVQNHTDQNETAKI